jgi:signal transduction histidine kinase/AmiR/NasT family two-component response regulator
MNILIVDDNPTNMKVLRATLEHEGHMVAWAPDGILALENLGRFGANAIISDILMPGMDGYRLCYEVRKNERFKKILFIVYTATYLSASDEKLSLDLGADVFLRKPAATWQILDALQKATCDQRDRGAPPRRTITDVEVMKQYSQRLVVKLEEENLELMRANKTKDQFLALLSHELRTALSPVLAILNLWEASDELSAAMQSDVRMMRRSVEREARIIDDLLVLARIAKDRLTFSPQNTDVHELLQFLIGICHGEFQSKRLTLSTHLDAARRFVHTDAGRLQQVLWNIITNAVKFTKPGGEITIATSNDALGNLRVIVNDSGIGMMPQMVSRLFSPFEQGDRRQSRRYGGVGLGMAISSMLVELLGGKFTGQSEGLDKGSTFTVTFPALTGPVKGNNGAKPPAVAKVEPGRRKILLVEDHTDTARALARLLTRRGYEMQTAGTVASGIEAVERGRFDLLLCDIDLPDGTGLQLIERVRERCQTPALALTGFVMEEDLAKCKRAGFEAYLTKPVNFQKLEATIQQLLPAQNVTVATNKLGNLETEYHTVSHELKTPLTSAPLLLMPD